MLKSKNILVFYFLLICSICANAQLTSIYDKNIHTVQCYANGDWSMMPIIGLNDESSTINISFDELSHDYHKYHYVIKHCDKDWRNTNMLETEYLDGFNDQTIDEYTQSMNTTTIFNHYAITLPNDQVHFKVSGNYMIYVFDDDKSIDEPSFVTSFYVVDRKISLSATLSGNTEINNRTTSQQLQINMNLGIVSSNNINTELTTKVMQNRRPETERAVQPDYVTNDCLQFLHNRQLIFDGNNEFRRFEMLNSLNGTIGIDYIRWNKQIEHYDVYLFTDEPRINYIYDEDHNGLYYIRNESRDDIDTESDYMLVHFKLKCEPMPEKRVYVAGRFSNYKSTPEYEMHYNNDSQCYEQSVLLKQGQYDYIYVDGNGKRLNTKVLPTEGNYYETRNEYEVFVYYRPFGSRYDQLVGNYILKQK